MIAACKLGTGFKKYFSFVVLACFQCTVCDSGDLFAVVQVRLAQRTDSWLLEARCASLCVDDTLGAGHRFSRLVTAHADDGEHVVALDIENRPLGAWASCFSSLLTRAV